MYTLDRHKFVRTVIALSLAALLIAPTLLGVPLAHAVEHANPDTAGVTEVTDNNNSDGQSITVEDSVNAESPDGHADNIEDIENIDVTNDIDSTDIINDAEGINEPSDAYIEPTDTIEPLLDPSDPEVIETRIVAIPREATSPEAVREAAREAGWSLVDNPNESNPNTLVIVKATAKTTENIAQSMVDSDLFVAVEYDSIVEAEFSAKPNDPRFSQSSQWGLKSFPGANFTGAWSLLAGKGTKAPRVAVIDDGFNTSHPDTWKKAGGRNFVQGNKDVRPSSSKESHGTAMAGIIGARGNNKIGITGAGFKQNLYAYKTGTGQGGALSRAAIVNAIFDATDSGVRVINMSFGSPSESAAETMAVEYAHSKGVVLVAASGNTGKNERRFPAAHPLVISVGSINSAGKRSSFSTFHSSLDMMAPGENIASLNLSSGYSTHHGTSCATAFVSAAAALVLRANPDLSAKQVKQILKGSAVPVGSKLQTGSGTLNARAAVATAQKMRKQAQNAKQAPSAKPSAQAANVTAIRSSVRNFSMKKGDSLTIPMIVRSSDSKNNAEVKISWKSNNNNVTLNNTKGKSKGSITNKLNKTRRVTFRAQQAGKTRFTFTAPNGKKTVYNITVHKNAQRSGKIQIGKRPKNNSMKKGARRTLSARIPEGMTLSGKVSWSSSNPKVASVDQAGRVRARKKGTTTITLKVGGQTASVKIRVR